MDVFPHLVIDNTKPVLFMDIDGVLNTTLSSEGFDWYTKNNDIKRRTNSSGFKTGDWVDVRKTKMLLDMLNMYETQIVIVSSWVSPWLGTHDPEIIRLKEFFGYNEILGSAYTGGCISRGCAVKDIVRSFNLTHWGVLDDAESMYVSFTPYERLHLISPWGRYGINEEQIERLQALFDPAIAEGVRERDNLILKKSLVTK